MLTPPNVVAASSNTATGERRPSSPEWRNLRILMQIHADRMFVSAWQQPVPNGVTRTWHATCTASLSVTGYPDVSQLRPTNNDMSFCRREGRGHRDRKLHRRRNLPYSLRFLYCKTSISRLESAARKACSHRRGNASVMRNLSGISTAGAAHPPVRSGRAVLDGNFGNTNESSRQPSP